MNPMKLLHLVPLQAVFEVAAGYWSSLLHQALLLEIKSYRMIKLSLDVGVRIATLRTISRGGGERGELLYEKDGDDCQKI